MERDTSSDPLANLITNYHELNSSIVDELPDIPSPLEFMRHVAKNRPFVVRGGARDWPACRKWNAAYLRKAMGNSTIKVANTPLGNADAIVEQEEGRLLFVEPHETDESFDDFLTYVQEDSALPQDRAQSRNVKYAQTQNGNLPTEYSALLHDVPLDISFATEALQQPPDAQNFWLGNHRSTTALHKDNYENIYIQIIGQKHFVLLPPVEVACVNEQPATRARYVPASGETGKLVIGVDGVAEAVPTPTWDPDEPSVRATAYSGLSRPLRVTLDPGDMFYLPAMWYHKVSQSNGPEGYAVAVNFWYDMSFDGGFWVGNGFLREIVEEGKKDVDYGELVTGGNEEIENSGER
ncbi:hypothetical protein B0A48_04581 [Cryoendolithus antarcticus]|uniref:JmjC domain-containing protein n=1 Tax=Cryoendolithus antarcticus TaxID=1507870 RepID=A0A1V8TG27_9PEZI|nr:hypothetical protein B0A48_04581 [Cryoendolithus antarcticus]